MYSKTYLHWLSVLLLLVAVEGCKRDKVEGSSALAPRDTKSNQGAESDAASLPTTEQGRGMSAKARITTGDKAPDFVLPSTSGTTMTLSSALKESAVALVFYRSAVW